MARIIADALGGDLDVVLVRKLRAPGQSELAIGAVDESGTMLEGRYFDLATDDYLREEVRTQLGILRIRREQYTRAHAPSLLPVEPASSWTTGSRVFLEKIPTSTGVAAHVSANKATCRLRPGRPGLQRILQGTSVARRSLVMQRMLFVLGLAVLSATLAGAQAQPNQCAECHLAHATAPGRGHVLDWESSAHKRSEIGCERCHGGNPATHNVLRAHFGVTSLRNPASLLNRRNVSATCGTCHSGPYAAFEKSSHAALLRRSDSRGPTCVTCHGETAAQLLSPDAVAAECNQCHGPGSRAPRPDRAAEIRQWLERVRDVRAQLAAVRPMIDAVRDVGRQQRLRDAYRQADAPLAQSVVNGHSFVFADSNERLDVARQRTAALYESIIASPSR